MVTRLPADDLHVNKRLEATLGRKLKLRAKVGNALKLRLLVRHVLKISPRAKGMFRYVKLTSYGFTSTALNYHWKEQVVPLPPSGTSKNY